MSQIFVSRANSKSNIYFQSSKWSLRGPNVARGPYVAPSWFTINKKLILKLILSGLKNLKCRIIVVSSCLCVHTSDQPKLEFCRNRKELKFINFNVETKGFCAWNPYTRSLVFYPQFDTLNFSLTVT